MWHDGSGMTVESSLNETDQSAERTVLIVRARSTGVQLWQRRDDRRGMHKSLEGGIQIASVAVVDEAMGCPLNAAGPVRREFITFMAGRGTGSWLIAVVLFGN